MIFEIMYLPQLSLTNEVSELQKAKNLETIAHTRAHEYLSTKLEQLGQTRTEWADKYDKDHTSSQAELTKLREESGACRVRLNELREKQAEEDAKRAADAEQQK